MNSLISSDGFCTYQHRNFDSVDNALFVLNTAGLCHNWDVVCSSYRHEWSQGSGILKLPLYAGGRGHAR